MIATTDLASKLASVIPDLCAIPELECALLYGSAARGDFEEHSDIDLLVLSGTSRKQRVAEALNASLMRFGSKVSVTIYTHRELKFLGNAQSLFLLHLKRESLVLFDRSGGFLERLFEEFQPKSSYHRDFEKSIALIDPVRKVVLGSPNQLHRLSQLYALYRVFGVYLLAEKGIYEFSKEKMGAELSCLYPQRARSISELSRLRRLNNLFYLGDPSGANSSGYLRSEEELKRHIYCLSDLLGMPVTMEERCFGDAAEEFSSVAGFVPTGLDYRLKTWFLLLVFDGLNLFCAKNGFPELVSLDEVTMTYLSSSFFPHSVQAAAREVLCYLRGYSLKYFLHPEAKIRSEGARKLLLDLVPDTIG
jgi:predicted nucleotidyltransferase